MSAAGTWIVGIGSSHGDDQLGWLVVDRLAEYAPTAGVRLQKAKSPPDLLDWLNEMERLIVCDACCGLGQVGDVRRWTWPTEQLDRVAWAGTHNLSLPAVLALAQRLGRLPQEVIVWGIEGSVGQAGDALSDGVLAAVSAVVNQIVREVNDGPCIQAQSCTSNR